MPHTHREIQLLEESVKKERKIFKLYDKFKYNHKTKAIQDKFYSKHSSYKDLSKVKPEHIEILIQSATPRIKCKPETTNQQYGWFRKLIVPLDRNDRRFYKPRTSNEFSKQNERISVDICLRKLNYGDKSKPPFKI